MTRAVGVWGPRETRPYVLWGMRVSMTRAVGVRRPRETRPYVYGA